MVKVPFKVFMDMDELTVRLMEAHATIKRPDCADAASVVATGKQHHPVTTEFFIKTAYVAAQYFGECIRDAKTDGEK